MAMRDAAVERLSKIIADPRPSDGGSDGNRRVASRTTLHLRVGLAEGWFSLFLLAAVVYSTIWCVEAADWVDNLNILSWTTLLGLIAGVLAAKQRRLPRLLVHPIAVVVGLLLAFWQTAGADYGGETTALLRFILSSFFFLFSLGTSGD